MFSLLCNYIDDLGSRSEIKKADKKATSVQKFTDRELSDDSGWKIACNMKYVADFLAIHVRAAKRDDLRIIRKFGKQQSQTEMLFEGEERFISYILVPLK